MKRASKPLASCAWKARSTWCRTATSCTSCSTCSDRAVGRNGARHVVAWEHATQVVARVLAILELIARRQKRPDFIECASEIDGPTFEGNIAPVGEQLAPARLGACAWIAEAQPTRQLCCELMK